MKIKSVEFKIGAVGAKDFPNDLPEIAVVGRSNVGKSSFLNFLLQRKNLLRTSKVPGKTREMNYYTVNQAFYLVDVPGFGYVKGSHNVRDKIKTVIENYFKHSKKILGIIYLLDSRHGLTSTDNAALDWMDSFEYPLQFILTKTDKLKKNQISQAVASVVKDLELPKPPLMTSSLKKQGREEVLEQLRTLLQINL